MATPTIHIPIATDLLDAAKTRAAQEGLSLAAHVRMLIARDAGIADSVPALGRPRMPWVVVNPRVYGGGICSRHLTREQAEAACHHPRLVLSIEQYDARVHLMAPPPMDPPLAPSR